MSTMTKKQALSAMRSVSPHAEVFGDQVHEWADAISDQPAQAVDVGAIREVIDILQADGAPFGVKPLADRLTRALTGEKAGRADGWLPIETAPKDGTPVLVWMRPAGELPISAEKWASMKFVANNRGDYAEWGFAAPVGMGGFPDSWIWRWMPLPASPAPDKEG